MSQYKSATLSRMIDIHFKDLSYEVQIGFCGQKKQILKGLNGFFKAGELTAIMGTSGAGKSTLLNVLNGFQQGRLTGTIDYIGNKGTQNWNTYKKDSCYIQQTDYLYDLFTVQESMIIATYLKIGNVTHRFRQTLTENILERLNLTKTKNTKISRLSGGQKKRLSIALELIDNPPIMFLDEPTTGLDSLASFQCISAMQTLAKNGRTIICTIHQPSAMIYEMFDHVYLIVDGQCMYAGTPANTVNYFARQGFQCPQYHNPADYMLEVVNGDYGNYDNQLITMAKYYCQRTVTPSKMRIKEPSIDERNVQLLSTLKPPSEIIKFMVLVCRSIMLMYRDWTTLYLKIIIHVLVAILLGLLFQHSGDDSSKTFSNIGFLIISVVFVGYTTLIPAVLKFPSEINILRKERFNNWYKLKTYYIATLVITLPLQILFILIYSSISYVLSSQPMEWHRFFMFLFILILTSLVSEGIGLGLGATFNPINGTFFGAVSVCIMLCLSGFLIAFNHMPVILYYVSYINYFRFSFEGLVQAIYGFYREKIHCPSQVNYCHLRIPSIILEELHMSKPMFWIDVVILFSWFVVIRIIVYVSLKKKLSKL
ncbi:ATP-binding cassette subfamily G member 4 [Cataglyphis hispanica]|uniref:ATP-binding cassette subfamily G member 4 n=1 Tax=Cataglyphis hispanica TaxID=1086592 RepID=UPI00217FFC0A|nr:ATP-binding cassette subfamily G member 4 [Cataglyphis hispanica]